jgi:flagellar L-ring protein precursor FlgH
MKIQNCAGLLVALGAIAPGAALAADATSAPQSLFADRRAHMPGDLITVLIAESASVSASAQTRTNKGESANAHLLQRDGEMQLADVGIEGQFAGGGKMERSGTLLGRLSVRIEALDANGNFIVSGEQLIVINNEKQTIRVGGLIRPDDIASDNTVPSWRVAGATVELVGKGLLSQKSAPGLLTRLLSLFGE